MAESIGASAAAGGSGSSQSGRFAGRYRLLRILGQGGNGVVWEAVHVDTGERVALKLLRPEAISQPDARRRLKREGRAAAALSHPNLVRVHGVIEGAGGAPAILMELLEGESLADHLRRARRLTLAQAANVLLPAFLALRALHALGLIHRDVKPANVFLARLQGQGPTAVRVKLLDLGLVKASGPAALPDTGPLTASGVPVGTPHYMAPEQVLGEADIDQRADVFAAGVLLFECLSGVCPTNDESVGKVFLRIVAGNFPSLADKLPGAPPDLVELVALMLQRDRSLRAPNLDGAIALLTRYADASEAVGAPVRVSWRFRARKLARGAALSAAAASAVALAAALSLPSPGCARPIAGMACIPGGTFVMGSTAGEVAEECRRLGPACRVDHLERETPARRVTLPEFYLDRHEVTNEELVKHLNGNPSRYVVETKGAKYRYVRDAQGRLLLDLWPDKLGIEYTGSTFRATPGRERWPAVQVTWDAALEFCRARGKRLPTEAEWERAARGPLEWPSWWRRKRGRRYPWGDRAPGCGDAVFGRAEGGPCRELPPVLEPVDGPTLDRTPDGVVGMGGNASEWVFDAFTHPTYRQCGKCEEPREDEPAPDGMRMVRGSSWFSSLYLRSSARARWKRNEASSTIGFRCATNFQNYD